MNAAQIAYYEAHIDAAVARGDLNQATALAQEYRRAAADGAIGASRLEQTPQFRAAFLSAQVALASAQLQETLNHLREVLPRVDELSSLLRRRVLVIAAEAAARLRRTVDARSYLDAGRRHTADPVPVMIQLRELCVRLMLGELNELAAELLTIRHVLQKSGDVRNLALLQFDEGLARESAGDVDGAMACWQSTLQFPDDDPTRQAIAANASLRMGRSEHLQGRLQASLNHYDHAQQRACSRSALWIEAVLRRYLVRLDLNQWEAVTSEFASLNLKESDLPEELIGLYHLVAAILHECPISNQLPETQAFLAARRGDIAAAREYYRQSHDLATGEDRRARLALSLGMLAASAGDSQEGTRWVSTAATIAIARNLPEILWRAYQTLGELAATLPDNDELARSYFEKAIAITESQQRQLKHRSDAATYNAKRKSTIQHLLRAAARRGDAASVLELMEVDRGRLLWDLCRDAEVRSVSVEASAEIAALDNEIAQAESRFVVPERATPADLNRHVQLLQKRDRLLEDYLRNQSRTDTPLLPRLPTLRELQRVLPVDSVCVAAALMDDDLILLSVHRDKASAVMLRNVADTVRSLIDRFRRCVSQQLERYRSGAQLGAVHRDELDHCLELLAASELGKQIRQQVGDAATRIYWIADGDLLGLPLSAFRSGGRYWVDDWEVVTTFSASLLTHQHRVARRWSWLPSRCVVIAESPAVLPMADAEARGVAATFWRRLTLVGNAANRSRIVRELNRASVIHFACHAHFDAKHPLAAHIGLPSGEPWRALDWLTQPVAGLPLVTLSACRSGEVAPAIGREVFGIVNGVLGAGVRAVVAGFWPIADSETVPLMWALYRELLTQNLAGALTTVQRRHALDPHSSPLFWAAFGLFGDAEAIPKPNWLISLLQRVLRGLHECRFPLKR